MKTLPLSKGYEAIVDDADYDWLSQWKWTAMVTGQHLKRVYAYRRTGWDNANRKWTGHVLMHRAILAVSADLDVDHINHNSLDNRRSNLREATRSQNLAHNRRPFGRFKYRGVTWDKRDGAIIAQCGGYLGRFPTEEEAARAYDRRAFERFGKFAKLNFPDEAHNGQGEL
jgi:hypothetical protein